MRLLLLATLTTAAQAAPTDRERNDAIFEASRARGFHSLVAARKCDITLPEQTKALNIRYDTAIAALVEIHGKVVLGNSQDAVPDEPSLQWMCSGTLMSFEEKIDQIEQRARQGKQ